jgi:histone-lysine N-methyltransferase SETMAR
MIVFFYLDGIVRGDFVPRKTTVNCEYYRGLLECLRNDVRRKWPEKWANGFILHPENAPCHTSLLVRKNSVKNITACPHPPYSPNLAPWDFWLFPKVKITMKCKHFESIQDIEAATSSQVKRTSRAASESGKNDEISMFEARGINGYVSFTVIIFFI